MAGRRPFKLTAMGYYDAGWLPLPLPPKRKEEPPTGYTGWNSTKTVTRAQIKQWESKVPDGANIAMRPSESQIGIDVDLYKGLAAEQWDEIIAEIGELPDTWISSARADGSGIRHYRLPEGYENLAWPGTVGDVIQFTHVGHRYAVLPPSRHPKPDADGNPMYYRWYEPGQEVDGNGTLDGNYPGVPQLALLPVHIIEYFTQGKFAKILPEKNLGAPKVATKKVSAWIAEHDGTPCAAMLRGYQRWLDAFGTAAAHDTMRDAVFNLASLAAEGHTGLSTVISDLQEDFAGEVRREGRAGTTRGAAEALEEWLRARDQGVKKVLARVDAGDFIGHACTCGALDATGKPKPVFNVTNFDFVLAMEQCYSAIAASEATDWYGAYNNGGKVYLRQPRGSRFADVNSLRAAVARGTDWLKPGGDGPPMKAIPNKDLLATMLVDSAIGDFLPPLRGVMNTPFWALVDGKHVLVHENGYHAESQIILEMDAKLSKEVANVRGEWADKAKTYIAEVFADFPFADPVADRAAAYAALLLPFTRELISGGTPLHLVDAPTAGTGKGLLTEVIGIITCGGYEAKHGFQKIGVTDDNNRNVEMTKEINSRLQLDPRIILLDNVNRKLDNGSLASALTSSEYQARIMGSNGVAMVANRALWFCTGNNPTVSRELERRIVPCRLNARVERPEERHNFLHDPLEPWLLEQRAKIVWSVLVLIQNWVEQGAPDGRERLGSYESWARVIGGILAVNGIPGLLTNRDAFKARAGDEDVSLEALIMEWEDNIGVGKRVELSTILDSLSAVEDLIPLDLKARDRKLGALLKGAMDQVIGGFMIGRVKNERGRMEYFLEGKGVGKVVKRRRRSIKVQRARG